MSWNNKQWFAKCLSAPRSSLCGEYHAEEMQRIFSLYRYGRREIIWARDLYLRNELNAHLFRTCKSFAYGLKWSMAVDIFFLSSLCPAQKWGRLILIDCAIMLGRKSDLDRVEKSPANISNNDSFGRAFGCFPSTLIAKPILAIQFSSPWTGCSTPHRSQIWLFWMWSWQIPPLV